MCKTAVAFMLNECLTVIVSRPENFSEDPLNIGNPQKDLSNAGDGDARPNTLSPLNDIKIYGEVSFTYKVTATHPSLDIVVGGRVDYGIGRDYPQDLC